MTTPRKPRKPRQRKPLEWSAVQDQAFELELEGRLSHKAIAQNCEVPSRTLDDWRAHPDWQRRLTEARTRMIESLSTRVGYVRKEQRIYGLALMAESARLEYEARPWLKEERQIGYDKENEMPLLMTNESYNAAAFAQFRGALDDIAKELGERGSNVKVSGNLTHSLVPEGALKELGDELLRAVKGIPGAREQVALRLLDAPAS
jgi:hypothetical protein